MIYCIVIGKWWGIFLVWIAFGLGPIKVGYWPTLLAAVVLWLLGLPLVAILVLVTLPLETVLVRQERRLKRESIALGDKSAGHHRPRMATVGNLSKSAIEEDIRSVFGAGGPALAARGEGELEVLWRDDTYSDSAPGMAASGVGVLCADRSRLRLLDAESGEERWSMATSAEEPPHTVIAVGEDFLLYYRMPKIEDDVVARIRGATGTVLWQRRQGRSPDPVACATHTVVVEDRFLMLVDVGGEVAWSTAPFHLGPREVACDGSRIAVLDLSNRVSMLDLDGEMLWRMRLDDDMRDAAIDSPQQRVKSLAPSRTVMLANLAMGQGEVVVTGERGAVCLEASDGSLRWAGHHRGGWTRPRISGNRVLIGLPNELVAVSLETGHLVWRHEFGDHPVTGVSSNGMHALVAGRRELHRLSLTDGEGESLVIGSAASPRSASEGESLAKMMRGLAPIPSPSGPVAAWIAGVGVVAVGG